MTLVRQKISVSDPVTDTSTINPSIDSKTKLKSLYTLLQQYKSKVSDSSTGILAVIQELMTDTALSDAAAIEWMLEVAFEK
jgi:hypothetical protein